jgi:hypothetical protein
MDAFHRLLQFGHAAKEHALPVWESARLQFGRGLKWLKIRPQARAALFSVGMGIVTLLLLIFSGVTAAVAALAAWFTLIRHFGQSDADRQRRITESFTKAVEQLGSDKLEVRLGGIYSLERISKESPDDYWTVMEILTAFVRERARWKEPDAGDSETMARQMPSTDIAAVLAVVVRRPETEQQRERDNGWRLDLRETDLRGANLGVVSPFYGDTVQLGVIERFPHLEGAYLFDAHLEGANLSDTRLEGAFLSGAHLEDAFLDGTHLEGTFLNETHLKAAYLKSAHLEGANLRYATGLSDTQLRDAHGNAATTLPEGLARPAHWPSAEVTAVECASHWRSLTAPVIDASICLFCTNVCPSG